MLGQIRQAGEGPSNLAEVNEAPPELSDADVLAAVRAGWDAQATGVVHLPVGFGAHHWRVAVGDGAGLFATYDRFGARHSATSLEAAYAGAIQLAVAGLEFVLAPRPMLTGQVLRPIGAGALSCTPWVDGSVVGDGAITDDETAAVNIANLARLHRSPTPFHLERWRPLDGDDLTGSLNLQVATRWRTGPYGEPARRAIADRLPELTTWTRRLAELVRQADDRPWVVTHGETHTRNQLRIPEGIVFVDWESLKLAPRERDLATLVQAGYGERVGADRAMVELFDLEWRLTEIAEYADWFCRPHTGSADDDTAYEGLLDELERGPWWTD